MAEQLTAIAFTPFAIPEPQPDWGSVIQKRIKIVWLISRPNANHESARAWFIAVHTDDNQIFTLHPQAPVMPGTIDIVFKPICSAQDAAAVQPGTTVYDFLSTIQNSGIQHYALTHKGRGLRFWLGLAVFVLQGQIKEPRNFDIMSHIALLKMRDSAALAAFKNITRNIQTGIFFPSLLSKDGYASWNKCFQRNEMISNEEKAFGIHD